MVRIPITDKSNKNTAAERSQETESTIHQFSATATPDKPQSLNNQENPPSTTATASDEGATPNSVNSDIESDPTVPPGLQPEDSERYDEHSLGKTASEVPGGADITGGELTAHQDADAALEEQQAQRTGEQDMFRRQAAGEVDTQTKDLKPHPAHPQEGLPPNPTGRENTGGTTPSDGGTGGGDNNAANGSSAGGASSGNAASSEASVGASPSAVARAASEHDERFLQLAADFENYKRQSIRRENEVREQATVRVLEDVLPVLDNFELAIKSAQTARDVNQVRIGVEYILQQLQTALRNHGVEPIEAKGQKFDPLQHDALEEVPDTDQPEGTVVEETQRGYSFKGRVLRPTRVRVAGRKSK